MVPVSSGVAGCHSVVHGSGAFSVALQVRFDDHAEPGGRGTLLVCGRHRLSQSPLRVRQQLRHWPATCLRVTLIYIFQVLFDKFSINWLICRLRNISLQISQLDRN